MATAALTGTAVGNITEVDVKSGGTTIIITLTGDTWVTAGANFDAQRQNIINGITSAQSEATGWNAVVRAGLAVTTVVRTSNTVATVSLSAFANYHITVTEVVTVTIPSTAVVGAAQIVATPTFNVVALILGIGSQAPNYGTYGASGRGTRGDETRNVIFQKRKDLAFLGGR